MAQTATLYLLDKKNLMSLQASTGDDSVKKKALLNFPGKTKKYEKKFDNLAIEKIVYRWSGMAFPILAVFSKEKLYVDWDNLEYSSIANDLSKNFDGGIYIFSINDEGLLRLRPDSMFYSSHDLYNFAIEFAGNKPSNPDIMKDAVGFLNNTLSKLTNDRVILLLIA
jgi:hypothetical protein